MGVTIKNKLSIRVLPDGRVSAADAATYTGLSPKTLANWRTGGVGLRWIRVGRKAWYYLKDLDSLIAQGIRETTDSRAAQGKSPGARQTSFLEKPCQGIR